MITTDPQAPPMADADPALLERLRAAMEVLETVSRDRALLENLPKPERKRLLEAVTRIHTPDPIDHRQRRRQRKREAGRGQEPPRRRRAQRHRHPHPAPQAGVHHAELLPAAGLRRPGQRDGRGRAAGVGRAAALLRLQAEVLADPPFLRPAVPAVRRVQLPQAHRTRRPARPRRAADRRPRQDRLPGRPEAAARRRAA